MAGVLRSRGNPALLKLTASCRDVVDFGCGYGIFTIPAAQIVRGTVHSLDVEPDMVKVTQAKAEAEGLRNVRIYLRDFVTEGTGLFPFSMDYAMLFNILHADRPEMLRRVLSHLESSGLLAIIHWNYDPKRRAGRRWTSGRDLSNAVTGRNKRDFSFLYRESFSAAVSLRHGAGATIVRCGRLI